LDEKHSLQIDKGKAVVIFRLLKREIREVPEEGPSRSTTPVMKPED